MKKAPQRDAFFVERDMRFELTTFSLATRHSTTELIPLNAASGRLYEEGKALTQAVFAYSMYSDSCRSASSLAAIDKVVTGRNLSRS